MTSSLPSLSAMYAKAAMPTRTKTPTMSSSFVSCMGTGPPGLPGGDNFGPGPDSNELPHGGMSGPLELRSEEHTSELQSVTNLVCRLLLEKKKKSERKKKELVVEDNVLNRELTNALHKSAGYSAATAKDGSETRLQDALPDVDRILRDVAT